MHAERCASCHGDTGLGDGWLAASLDLMPIPLSGPDVGDPPSREMVLRITSVGMHGTPMPAFGQPREADRWAIAAYLEHFRGANAAPAPRPND